MYLHCHGFSRHASVFSVGSVTSRVIFGVLRYMWFSFVVKKQKREKEPRKKTKQRYHRYLLLLTFFSQHNGKKKPLLWIGQCMHMHTERYGICCFCFIQKRKKCTKKTLTFQMQRWKTDSFNTAEHQDTQYYKRINMEDSQRQTWRTKTWFYPRFKSLKCILLSERLSGFKFHLKTFHSPCPELRPAPFSSYGEEATRNHVAVPEARGFTCVWDGLNDRAIIEEVEQGRSVLQQFHLCWFSFPYHPQKAEAVRIHPRRITKRSSVSAHDTKPCQTETKFVS